MKLNKIIGPEVSTSYCIGFANSLKSEIKLSDEYENVMSKIKYTLSPFINKEFVTDVENSISNNDELEEYLIHWHTLCNRGFSPNDKKITPENESFVGRLTQEMIFAYFYGLMQYLHNTTAHETNRNYEIFLNAVSKKFCSELDDERLFELMGFFDTHPIFGEIETSIFEKFSDSPNEEKLVDCSPLHNFCENNDVQYENDDVQFCETCNSDLGFEDDYGKYCNDCRMKEFEEEYNHEHEELFELSEAQGKEDYDQELEEYNQELQEEMFDELEEADE